MNRKLDDYGQASTELTLLFAGIFVIVLMFMNIYQSYVASYADEIKNNELNDLINKIDNIKTYMNK